jgi:hypothetical protein
MANKSRLHRVGRVLSFFSSRRNWDSPTPLAAGECAPPPFGPGGREHSPAEKGVGSPNSEEGTYTVVLYVYKYFVVASLFEKYVAQIFLSLSDSVSNLN